jgi:S1-C subfamily serine protease
VARRLRRSVGLPERDGILVRGVEEDGPADAAGIREGDLIVSAGGSAIVDPDALHAVLAKAGSGTIEIGLVRGAEELTVKATLAAMTD